MPYIGGLYMKTGIFQGCFPQDMQLDQCMDLARRIGFDAIELSLECPKEVWEDPAVAGNEDVMNIGRSAGLGDPRPGALTIEYTDGDLESVAQSARKSGTKILGLASLAMFAYPLTSETKRVSDKGMEVAEKLIKAGAFFGAESVLIMPGMVTSDTPYDVAWERSKDALKSLLKKAKQYGVKLAVENVWNKFLLSPLEMTEYIDSFNSDYARVYFDVGNVAIYGYPEQWIRILGHRISNVHLKDFSREVGNICGFTHLLAGDVDWPRVMSALKQIGYDGYVTLEVPPYRHLSEKGLEDSISTIRRLIEMR
ncbi:MAG TPA: sugar phosphate isomerase/epimerase [Corynebacteriales bacterium]|nr:sugar phosphate isomerase/epimerase [Mycobacteriales bacterium]